jgi:hypothetical protein
LGTAGGATPTITAMYDSVSARRELPFVELCATCRPSPSGTCRNIGVPYLYRRPFDGAPSGRGLRAAAAQLNCAGGRAR